MYSIAVTTPYNNDRRCPPCRLRNQIATLREEKPQSLEKVLDSTSNEVQQMQRSSCRVEKSSTENHK